MTFTPEEITAMAKEAHGPITGQWWDMDVAALQRFAALVAAKEREACAAHIVGCVAPVGVLGSRIEIGLPARIAYAEAVRHRAGLPAIEGCRCEACEPNTLANMRFITCAICGNKRCPHAADHRNACTNSNEPGQKGSSWEHVQPARARGQKGGV